MCLIVALTGGIGSGKSTVAYAFAQLGVPVVDADVIARQLVQPGSVALSAILSHFGHHLALPDGQLDRTALRKQIFSCEQDKQWLNQLLHPLIQQETQRQWAAIDAPYLLWVVPLLIENNLQQYADRILVVDVADEVQLSRTMHRDNCDRQQAEKILAAQTSRQSRLNYADDLINNDGEKTAILPLVQKLHQSYLSLANSTPLAGRKYHE